MIRRLVTTSILMTLALTVLCGGIYPLVMTGLAQLFFHDQANGSLLTSNGQVVGSSLIGQNFTKPQYFHGRASATVDANGKPLPYNAANSGGTNQGPTNKTLLTNTVALAAQIRKEDGLPPNYELPSDAVSSSASGLDPNISPAYADLQVARVARVRGLSQDTVRSLVARYTSSKDLGVFGSPRVNVLQLNLALDGTKK